MTQNKRILLNVVSTYGRSLFALACGIFTARWVLLSLGTVDYGLFGVVGGLTGFVVFISYILQGATSRFYAFTLGAAQNCKSPGEGLIKCQEWFNTSLCIHLLVPIVLLLVGYFVGVWAIDNFLTIPSNRINACQWVFGFACISCFVSMSAVPYYGMYIAKQYIAELTIYGFATTFLTAILAYYMSTHPGEWLIFYSACLCLLNVTTQIVIIIRATILFPECRIKLKYWWSRRRFKELIDYAGWNFIGAVGRMLQMQGSAVLINKYSGPSANAGFSLANSINGHCQSIVTALRTAFIPAVTTLCGARKYDEMCGMALRSCKFATILALVFVLPLSIELNQILCIWLGAPPQYTEGLCLCIMAAHVIENLGMGHSIAICAFGKVAKYQCVAGGIRLLVLPVAWCWIAFGGGVYCVGYTFVLIMLLYTVSRAFLAKSLARMPIVKWVIHLVLPTLCVSTIVILVGWGIKTICPPSFPRMILVGLITEMLLLPVSWFFVLDCNEREFLASKIRSLKERSLNA